MNWYSRLQKIAVGHGDTLHGQFLAKERERLANRVRNMRSAAASGGPDSVLPRWRGEIRRKMLMLPPSDKIAAMSSFELRDVDAEISEIERLSKRYNASRVMGVLGS